nr:bifunctional hydroxymethylpyrimidine kinase/phosphomethylpyrimidine kinase [uncultured Holophaga sp.]
MDQKLGTSSPIPVALCLGGLDPSGGAGLSRDIQVLSTLGAYPMPVCTAETLQTGQACHRIAAPRLAPAECILALRPHLTGTWGLKLGLSALSRPALAACLTALPSTGARAMIWDPIAAPTSGTGLHSRRSLLAMARVLLPAGGWTVAPNRQEACLLLGRDSGDPARLATPWLELGAEAVWLKGGHAEGDQVQDLWISREGVFPSTPRPRLPGERRGTGCTLAAAWLALRLHGAAPREAAEQAGAWLHALWPRAGAPGGFGRPAFLPEVP